MVEFLCEGVTARVTFGYQPSRQTVYQQDNLFIIFYVHSPRRHWSRRERDYEQERLERVNLVRERQLRSRLEAKRKEQALEEIYDKMVNPHLYGKNILVMLPL